MGCFLLPRSVSFEKNKKDIIELVLSFLLCLSLCAKKKLSLEDFIYFLCTECIYYFVVLRNLKRMGRNRAIFLCTIDLQAGHVKCEASNHRAFLFPSASSGCPFLSFGFYFGADPISIHNSCEDCIFAVVVEVSLEVNQDNLDRRRVRGRVPRSTNSKFTASIATRVM